MVEKIRILHFIDPLGAGGAERQLVYLLQNLDRAQFESYIVTTYDEFRHYEAELRHLCVPIYSLRNGELRIVNRLQAVARYVSLVRELCPHIVHGWLHYPNLIARISRPFCPDHRLITAIRTQYSGRELISERWTQCSSDFRIVMYGGEDFRPNGITHKPITVVIPNGIDHLFFEQNNKNKDNKLRTEHGFNILMAARIDPRKDHNILLEALYLLAKELPPRLKVTFIGDATNLNTQQQVNYLIREYKLDSIVEQIPTTANILPYYQMADISVLPSHSEGFPNVILESFATGTPVIASEAANRAEIVQHGVNGWVFSTGDSRALALCIRAALETTNEQRRLMGDHARAVSAEYSIEKMVARYQQLYERALK